VRRHLLQAHREILDRLTPERFVGEERRATVGEAIAVLFDHTTRYPAMNRVFREMSIRDPDVASLKRVFDREGRRRLALLVAAVTDPRQVPDPEATALVIFTAVVEGANLLADPDAPVARERMEAALGDMILRTLFPPAP
jgi:hypothetical protein